MRGRSVPFLGAVLLSVVVLFTPGAQVPSGPWWAGYPLHITLFALLALTGQMRPIPPGWLAIGLTGYAAVSEVAQSMLPIARTGSVVDLLADLIGIGVGLLVMGAGHTVRQRRTHRTGVQDTLD